MPNRALIIVDYQNDFLPGGALGVADGHQAYLPLRKLMGDVDIIVFTRDWHPEDHCSFVEPGLNPEYRDGSWPKHCVQGTEGAEIDDALWDEAVDTDKPVILVNKGFEQDKEAYSGFQGIVSRTLNYTGADLNGAILAQVLYRLNVNRIDIGGLALDYCVKATALDARTHCGNTNVYLAATRPVAYLTGAAAVAELAVKGVRLNDTDYLN